MIKDDGEWRWSLEDERKRSTKQKFIYEHCFFSPLGSNVYTLCYKYVRTPLSWKSRPLPWKSEIFFATVGLKNFISLASRRMLDVVKLLPLEP